MLVSNMNKEKLDKMPEWFRVLRKAIKEDQEKKSRGRGCENE